MRLSNVLRSLGSGIVVYLVVAACGSSDSAINAMLDGGLTDSAIALVDGIANPIGEASADPLPPDIATEQCDKAGTTQGQASLYAVHAYPGKTINDLSSIRVIAHSTAQFVHVVEGSTYGDLLGAPQFRDGSVAVYCGPSATLFTSSVTFILPQ